MAKQTINIADKTTLDLVKSLVEQLQSSSVSVADSDSIKHSVWLNDFKTYGEASFVYNNSNVYDELMHDYNCIYDNNIRNTCYDYANSNSFFGEIVKKIMPLSSDYTGFENMNIDECCLNTNFIQMILNDENRDTYHKLLHVYSGFKSSLISKYYSQYGNTYAKLDAKTGTQILLPFDPDYAYYVPHIQFGYTSSQSSTSSKASFIADGMTIAEVVYPGYIGNIEESYVRLTSGSKPKYNILCRELTTTSNDSSFQHHVLYEKISIT